MRILGIFMRLNILQYSEAIPELLMANMKTELFYNKVDLSNKILLINFLKTENNQNDLCEQALKYGGVSEYFLKKLIIRESLQNQHISHAVKEYNKLVGF